MALRMSLHRLLVELLGSDNVYFQPPPEFKMKYPCIVYHLDKIHSAPADNTVYKTDNRYLLTVIDPDPDGGIKFDVSLLPRCIHDRHFNTSNLNHDVFSIIF